MMVVLDAKVDLDFRAGIGSGLGNTAGEVEERFIPGRLGDEAGDGAKDEFEDLILAVVGVGISSSGVVPGDGLWICRPGTGDSTTAGPMSICRPVCAVVRGGGETLATATSP